MKKFIYCIFLLFLVFIGVNKSYAFDKYIVTLNKCVDGDTAYFNLNDNVIKTRFLAIDTPESTNQIEPYGKEASKFTCDSLTNAEKIEIEYDPNSDKTDKYNRDLVWVWVDDILLQETLIKNGLAEVKYLYGDYDYTARLQKVESDAKINKLKIWSNEETKDDSVTKSDDVMNTLYFISIIIVLKLFRVYIIKKKRKKRNS